LEPFFSGRKAARDVKFITSIWWEVKISWKFTTALGFQKKGNSLIIFSADYTIFFYRHWIDYEINMDR